MKINWRRICLNRKKNAPAWILVYIIQYAGVCIFSQKSTIYAIHNNGKLLFVPAVPVLECFWPFCFTPLIQKRLLARCIHKDVPSRSSTSFRNPCLNWVWWSSTRKRLQGKSLRRTLRKWREWITCCTLQTCWKCVIIFSDRQKRCWNVGSVVSSWSRSTHAGELHWQDY